METLIENLNWRYATKRFEKNKKIDKKTLKTLKEAVRLSASSYGLQPYEVIIVENQKIKEQLRAAAYDQPQLTEASHIFIFASYQKVKEEYIEYYMQNVAETRGLSLSDLNQFATMIKNASMSLPLEKQASWTSNQAYLALGFLLTAAAEIKIDACPMEGFDNQKFDEILNLNEKGLQTAVIAAVGYRSENDQTQNLEKVRKSNQELFTTI